MKIALLGDVHANLPALERVLAHAHEHEVDAIWYVGDWVGYNAFPNEVIARLRREGAVSIAGNYDLKVLKFKKKQKKWRRKKHPKKYLAFKWAYDTLTEEHRRYLQALPRDLLLRFKKISVLLTHGTPASNSEGLSEETSQKRLRQLSKMTPAQVIVSGHSHRPFARRVKGVWFINTGSVGRPDDGDPRPSYAILTMTAKKVKRVEHYRLEYDVERAVAGLRDNGLPPAFGQMLVRGCNLDELEASQANSD